MEQNQNTSLFGLSIDPSSKAHLAEAARWARFLAIVGFILCGLIVVLGIFAGSVFSTMMGRMGGGEFGDAGFSTSGFATMLSVIYICMALLYFFPCLFLFRFANHMKAALASNEQETLNSSFQNLKKMFRFVGILMIIVLAFYAIALIIGIVAGATMGS
ncbi:MAG: hypothetical protein EPN92_00945 [Chitinophagaceae bacterium]|nr:MAG: hypothetical protein EPN92_00945 [Chitinophagaceae bacterium]